MATIKSSVGTTYGALHIFSLSAARCHTSSASVGTRDAAGQQWRGMSGRRQHATTTHTRIEGDRDESHWPAPPKGHTCPTPYQILAVSKSAPYSKARFYELVKLYHPDRSQDNATCTHATKLERYRLIVAAHAILSDPVKRNAYDLYGAGWAGKADVRPENPFHHSGAPPGPFTSGAWKEHHPNIWANATWEDWERWRHHQEGKESGEGQGAPVISNSTFISIVLVLAAVGSSWNYSRAEQESDRFLAARDAIHDQASRELRKVRQSTQQRPKDERIDWFVKNREAALMGMGIGEVQDERARHILPLEETCMPREINDKEE